jgi:hypothetical protein
MRMKRWIGTFVLAAVMAASWGCAHAPRKFAKIDSQAPMVRARAVGLAARKPDAQVLPALVERLDDDDPVVRLAAHEELRKRTGQDFGYLPWASPEERAGAVAQWRAWLAQGAQGSGVTASPQLAARPTKKRKFQTIKASLVAVP